MEPILQFLPFQYPSDFWLSIYPRINQALTNSPHLYLTLLLNSPRVNIPPLSVTITLSGLWISSQLYMSLLLRFLSHLNMELLLHIRGSISPASLLHIPPLSGTITLSGLRISSHLYMSLLLRFLSHLNMELLLHIRGSISPASLLHIPPLSGTITLSGLRISSHLYMSLLLRFLSHLNMELLLHIRGSIPTLPCYTLTCYFLSSLVTA